MERVTGMASELGHMWRTHAPREGHVDAPAAAEASMGPIGLRGPHASNSCPRN